MSSSPSLGQQFIAANSFDELWDGYSQEFAQAETARFMEWVAAEYPGEYAGSPTNVKTFTAFFQVNEIPFTLHNMKVAWIYLRSEKLLEKEAVEFEPEPEPNVKYSRPVAQRVEKTEEQKAAEAAEIGAIGTIGPGVRRGAKLDVDPNLRAAYQRSLVANRYGGKKRHMSEGEARAQVAKQFPHLKPDSTEFNIWCARLQFNQND